MTEKSFQKNARLIWNIAETLRSHFKASEYGKIVLPFVVLRRLDAILETTRSEVVKVHEQQMAEGFEEEHMMPWMENITGFKVYNTYSESLRQIGNKSPEQARDALVSYVFSFDPEVRDIFHEQFEFDKIINKLHEKKILYGILKQFIAADLHPDRVSNEEMGAIFEELLRRFSEMSNETAGEHYTPRDALHLLADLIIVGDEEFRQGGKVRWAYDPTAGTGGILSVLQERAALMSATGLVKLYGQEMNGESYAICKSDLLLKGQEAENIKLGNTLTDDKLASKQMHWIGANPPYGVEWKSYAGEIREEHEVEGAAGRYGAGLPRVSDGQLLFVQHIVSKLRNDTGRAGIVTNGSPLFTGGAGSGESEIRRWLIEHDLLDAIVALPTDMFYNTGIQTYIWIIDKNKPAHRAGKVQLIDASGDAFYKPMRKALGSKRRELTEEGRQRVVDAYLAMEESDISKVFEGEAFGYREVRVERPLRLRYEITEDMVKEMLQIKAVENLDIEQQKELMAAMRAKVGKINSRDEITKSFGEAHQRVLGKKAGVPILNAVISHFSVRDENAEASRDAKGNLIADSELRDTELVPLGTNLGEHMSAEVLPFVGDAWLDESLVDNRDLKAGKVGYEINFNRYFYKTPETRSVQAINTEIRNLELEIFDILQGMPS